MEMREPNPKIIKTKPNWVSVMERRFTFQGMNTNQMATDVIHINMANLHRKRFRLKFCTSVINKGPICTKVPICELISPLEFK